jgi:hypothetical protein
MPEIRAAARLVSVYIASPRGCFAAGVIFKPTRFCGQFAAAMV